MGMPRQRFLDHEAISVMQATAEEHFHSQLGFILHDIESLFISDVEKAIQESTAQAATVDLQSDAATLSNDQTMSLTTSLNQVMFQPGDDLVSRFSCDADALARDVDRLQKYQEVVKDDLQRLEMTQKSFQELYQKAKSSK